MDTEENEIGFIDILTVCAENFKILVLGPIFAGFLALGVGYALPQSFVSRAILVLPMPSLGATPPLIPTPTPAQAAVTMISPLVLDPVVRALNLSTGRPIELVRSGLSKQVSAVAGKDGLLRLEVTASTPRDAQVIANAILDTWLKSTVPGERDRADLEKRLSYAKSSLESVRHLLDRLTAEGVVSLNKPLTRGEAGTSIVAVGELEARYFFEVLNITKSLQGLSKEVVIQEPTLPSEPAAPKKTLMAVAAAIVTGFVLLLWVFALYAWKCSMRTPQMSAKQAKLRAALGFGGRQD